jgi:MFS family permease
MSGSQFIILIVNRNNSFQEIQHVSALTTSLYLLPELITGVLINVLIGLFVHKVPARWLGAGSAFICAFSPLIMALMPPAWSYWKVAFWAQILTPFSAGVLFTVGLIVVSDSFPEETQALAGAVFNTVAQFGMSLGMGSCQVVALGVQGSASGGYEHGSGSAFEDQDERAVLKGYRASFWLMFGYMVVCMVVAIVGLRKAGKVGLKKDLN